MKLKELLTVIDNNTYKYRVRDETVVVRRQSYFYYI